MNKNIKQSLLMVAAFLCYFLKNDDHIVVFFVKIGVKNEKMMTTLNRGMKNIQSGLKCLK